MPQLDRESSNTPRLSNTLAVVADKRDRGTTYRSHPVRSFSEIREWRKLLQSPSRIRERSGVLAGLHSGAAMLEIIRIGIMPNVLVSAAVRIGLVDRIVQDVDEGYEFAEQWLPFSRSAIAGIMAASLSSELPIADGLVREGLELARLSTSADGIEGVSAFFEKRVAVFNR